MPDTMLGSLALLHLCGKGLIDFKAFNRKGTEYLYCNAMKTGGQIQHTTPRCGSDVRFSYPFPAPLCATVDNAG